MGSAWDHTLFDKELGKVLRSKSSISQSLISNLQGMALNHVESCDYISKAVVKFIQKVPVDYRVFGLYVMNAICDIDRKHGLDVYIDRFTTLLHERPLSGLFIDCSEKDKEKVRKLLGIWEKGKIYSKELLDDLGNSLFGTSTKIKNQGHAHTGSSLPLSHPPYVDMNAVIDSLQSFNHAGGRHTVSPPTSLSSTNENEVDTTYQPAKTINETLQSGSLSSSLMKLLGGMINTDDTNTQAVAPVEPPELASPSMLQYVSNDPHLPSSPYSHQTLAQQQHQYQQLQQHQQQYQHQPWFTPQSFAIPPSIPEISSPPVPTRQGVIRLNRPETSPLSTSTRLNSPRNPPQVMIPTYDRNLPVGSIRVLTRSLYVGPIPLHYSENELENIFSQYGDIVSITLPKPGKKPNAFLKYATHQATRIAKYNSMDLTIENKSVKVNWAFGFGPRRFFNYDSGESIIPLSALTDDERQTLIEAKIGGFGGQALQDRMAIEEPEATYKPEWKKDTLHPHRRQHHHQIGPASSTHKRRLSGDDRPRKNARFDDDDDPHGWFQ